MSNSLSEEYKVIRKIIQDKINNFERINNKLPTLILVGVYSKMILSDYHKHIACDLVFSDMLNKISGINLVETSELIGQNVKIY